MTATARNTHWARLFRIARALISQINSEQIVIDEWTLGGGTAMMLQIDHRESRDVDIFLTDPQLLALLDPEKRDFAFELRPAGYSGDGSKFVKFFFEGIGEIDFIVGRALVAAPATIRMVEGENVLLETVQEVIAKKIYYRGSSIKPRDIFDIAAAGEKHADSVIAVLREYRDQVARTLLTIETLNADFVGNAIAELAIKEAFLPVAKTALQRTKEILRAV